MREKNKSFGIVAIHVDHDFFLNSSRLAGKVSNRATSSSVFNVKCYPH